jgi:ABC-type cobalt transport system substrate-binding protein
MRPPCNIVLLVFIWQFIVIPLAYAEDSNNVSSDASDNWGISNIDPAYIGLLGVLYRRSIGIIDTINI